jgi:hypothetical protein
MIALFAALFVVTYSLTADRLPLDPTYEGFALSWI